jgi:two-component system sensor histidine kinase/response regulator
MSGAGTQLSKPDSAGPKPKLRALLVEDNEVDAELTSRELCQEGFDVSIAVVQTAAEFRRRVKLEVPDIILADYNLGDWRGIEAVEMLRAESLDIPLIIVTGALGDVTAVECIKQGATDYVLKDGLARLPEAIRRALREKHERMLRRQAEANLARKVDELARSNSDLEQFAYIASHDLQEPLRMVSAYTQLLSERYAGKLDENADKFLGYAREGAQRMQVLIKDLLAFSRVGRNVATGNVECDEVMKEAIDSLASAIQESGAIVTHALLPAVWAERTEMAQVFQNLIGNAIKFREKAPPIISVGVEKAGEHWLFSVKDNGIGIASENVESIFLAFQRLHARSEYPGNGIGLAICKKIIELYGGKIWAESQPGSGSTFKFTLPCHGSDQPRDERHDEPQEARP